jgi:hypothetical protein
MGCWPTSLAILCARCRYTVTDDGLPVDYQIGRSLAQLSAHLSTRRRHPIKMRMNEQTTEFDWSPLGSAIWEEAQKTTGASDMQTRFACCRHRGMTAVGSARAAGYAGDADSIRQAGSRAAKSTAVMAMVQLAQIEQAGGDDGTLSGPEARRILSKLARGSDPSVRIKAIETLNRIDREERDRQAASTGTPTLEDMMSGILAAGEMGVGVVAVMALAEGIDISYPPLKEIAPHIKRDWPDIWQKMISRIGKINPDTQARWIKYGDAPLVDLGQFKPAGRSNGAAVIESEEAASAAL